MSTNQTRKFRVTQDSDCNGQIVREYRFRTLARFAAWIYDGHAVTGEAFTITFEEPLMTTRSTRDQMLGQGGLPAGGDADTPLITSMLAPKFTFILRDADGNEIARMVARNAQAAFDAYLTEHGVEAALVEEV